MPAPHKRDPNKVGTPNNLALDLLKYKIKLRLLIKNKLLKHRVLFRYQTPTDVYFNDVKPGFWTMG